eukprot:CAMPEP_0185901604 /NCGR_PEP_ID=MMETSP0196C-20130402/953_1 /TAXON_ID=2932 /ORGANISM="Alexandrium fundyense, Strain CCMP1719" /LENGTH=80 /DNA_ID=CAMNT_0028620283 /DNA_START=85 /DNA_END=323 /DNA_ORIENTATION=-
MAFMAFMAFIAPGFFMTAFMAFIGSGMAGAAEESAQQARQGGTLLDVDGLCLSCLSQNGYGLMAHKSNPYKKARSMFRWK